LEVYKGAFELQQAVFEVSKCGYLSKLQFDEFRARLTGIGRQLGSMINQHESFCY
jgi:hypothetical protein